VVATARLLSTVVRKEEQQPPPGGADLLFNSNFRDTSDFEGKQAAYWIPMVRTTSFEPEAKCYRDTAVKYHGKPTLLIEKQTTKNPFVEAGFLQNVPKLPNGERVTLSGFVKTEDVKGNAFIRLQWHGSREPGNGTTNTPYLTGTNDWKYYEVQLDITQEATAQVILVMTGKGKAWFSDIELRTSPQSSFVPIRPMPRPEMPEPRGAQVRKNLLTNGGFDALVDDLPEGWQPVGRGEPGITMNVDRSIKRNGQASATIRNDNNNREAWNWSQDVVGYVPVGKVVKFTGWVQTKEAGSAAVAVQLLDSNGQIIAFHTTQHAQPFEGTAQWKPFTLRFPVPRNTARIGVLAMLMGRGQVWFDDFEMIVEGK
jgi:hypothetical protein